MLLQASVLKDKKSRSKPPKNARVNAFFFELKIPTKIIKIRTKGNVEREDSTITDRTKSIKRKIIGLLQRQLKGGPRQFDSLHEPFGKYRLPFFLLKWYDQL